MNSRNYLSVQVPTRTTLADKKQKSCESYDSTSSNYSQPSDCSEYPSKPMDIPKPKKSNNLLSIQGAEGCAASSEALSSIDTNPRHSEDSGGEHKEEKTTFWQKTVSSIKDYRNRSIRLKRHKSVSATSAHPQKFENNTETEIDPVYHLLKCAATQARVSKSPDPGSESRTSLARSSSPMSDFSERSNSLACSPCQFSKSVCIDNRCPCNHPERLPVVKKEDIGQQHKKEHYMKASGILHHSHSVTGAMTGRRS